MKSQQKVKLSKIIQEFSCFLETEYSSKFKYLSTKEDRQLFSLAKILTQLKQLQKENVQDRVIEFPISRSLQSN